MLFNSDDWGSPLQASPNLLLLTIKPKYLHASGTNSVKMSSPSKTSPAINVLHLISIEMRHLNAFLDSSRVQHGEVRKWMCLLDPKTSSKLLQSDSSCYCQLLLRLDQWTRLQLEPERQASAPPSHLPLCRGKLWTVAGETVVNQKKLQAPEKGEVWLMMDLNH